MLLTPNDDMRYAPIGSCVYVVQCNEYTKIGRASHVLRRIAGLQVGCPYQLEIKYVHYTLIDWRVERDLHRELAKYTHRGEWFLLPDLDLITWSTELVDWQITATVEYALKAGVPPKNTPIEILEGYRHYWEHPDSNPRRRK